MYLSIKDTNNFGFKDNKINEILETTDIQISEDIYNKFFEEQEKGKQFKIKDAKGETFEEIFEEVIPKSVEPGEIEPSLMEKLQSENVQLKKEISEQRERSEQAVAELTNLILATQIPQA